MKALSLTQPWATLVALGAKRIETRSWSTRQHGRIAIHAAKGFPRAAREACNDVTFSRVLEHVPGIDYKANTPQHWYHVHQPSYRGGLPLGAIVAVANLVTCVPTKALVDLRLAGGKLKHGDKEWPLTTQEMDFGDYADGRWGWLLTDAIQLSEPVECKGALGLWTVPEDIQRRVMERTRQEVAPRV